MAISVSGVVSIITQVYHARLLPFSSAEAQFVLIYTDAGREAWGE
jgi:hypothetical protein